MKVKIILFALLSVFVLPNQAAAYDDTLALRYDPACQCVVLEKTTVIKTMRGENRRSPAETFSVHNEALKTMFEMMPQQCGISKVTFYILNREGFVIRTELRCQ